MGMVREKRSGDMCLLRFLALYARRGPKRGDASVRGVRYDVHQKYSEASMQPSPLPTAPPRSSAHFHSEVRALS